MWLPGGYTKVPWGFEARGKCLVATTSAAQRNARNELGEFAIGLLGKLGISEEVLGTLSQETDPIEALKKMQEGTQ